MIRDFVAGLAWGTVVSAVGLGVVSQVAPLPGRSGEAVATAPQVTAPEEPAPRKTAEAAPESPAPVGPAPAAPAPEAAAKPATGAAPTAPAPAQPSALAEAPAPANLPPTELPPADPAPVMTDAAPAPSAQPAPKAPGQPAGDDAPKVAPQAPAALPQIEAPVAPAQPATGESPSLPGAEEGPAGAPAPAAAIPAPASEPPPAAADLPPAAPQPSPDPLLQPSPEAAPEPAPAAITPEPEPEPEPEPSTLPADPGLAETAPGVTVGRLPAIGTEPAPAEAPKVEADLPPIRRHAATFANPAGKPLFALILVDDGSPALDRAQLAALPFPVTFVVDPLAANAAEAAATYRAAGQEVAMMASGIPAGATASDLEQSFQALDAALPQAVAVIDLATGGFQDDRTLAAQVVPIVQAQGRGLLTYDRGLNAADQVARRQDLPAATIFRQLDAEGEDGPVLRRYLDRAAFKAAQEGRVAVIGSTRPETVAAILEWTVEGRAASVALAPVTAVMTVN